MTTFLFYQAELHRKALTRIMISQQSSAASEHQSPLHSSGLTLNLGELEEHFSAPSCQASGNTGTSREEGSNDEEASSAELNQGTSGDDD